MTAAQPQATPPQTSLSLFDIEAVLHELMESWQEAATPEAVAAAEQAIQAYAQAEVRKVDGIRRYLKACENQAAAAKAEMQAQAQRVRMWEARRDRLKAFVYDTMNAFGVRKLEGATGSLSIRGNGGVEPLTITDAEMIPEGLCDYHVTIPGDLWCALLREAPQPLLDIIGARSKTERVPNNGRIRAELESRCGHCAGIGERDIRGTVFEPGADEDNLVEDCPDCEECPDCAGTGKRLVAGARLENRGESLVCK